MSNSLTIQQGMIIHNPPQPGDTIPWMNPNVYPTTMTGDEVSVVQSGGNYNINAVVQNNGTETETGVTVNYYMYPGGTQFVCPTSPYGSITIASLAAGGTQLMVCPNMWLPDIQNNIDQCLIAVVYSDACPSPVQPGDAFDLFNPQIGQHNITVTNAANAMELSRTCHIENAGDNCKIVITRTPLDNNRTTLERRDVNPYLQEAPIEDSIHITDIATGESTGNTMSLLAGKSYDLRFTVSFKEGIQEANPATGALYSLEQYENGVLIGGVSLLITF